MNRKEFLNSLGITSTTLLLMNSCSIPFESRQLEVAGVKVESPKKGEDVFSYIRRVNGKMDLTLYRKLIGAANEMKEGDQTLGLVAESDASRQHARTLLANTKIKDLMAFSLYEDEQYQLIAATTSDLTELGEWTMGELKTFILTAEEKEIKDIMPGLSSDVIGCIVKLMSNEELIQVGQKVFNPLPGSKIGAKGYMSARVQPNSPTDNIDDITWQVFDAWSFAVGDLVLGTNPVSSEVASVARIEKALFDILQTFKLEKTLSNCVLSHIDIQAEAEEIQPGTTGIWFQSLAGTVNANKTFDVSIEKMQAHASKRKGQYGMYAETGQGADFTNGHGEGFDMVVHESRKYGFVRALKQQMEEGRSLEDMPWVHVNDVAGFIGPEVFKSKEQLVRCCLEDTVMGKLHGLTIGLDICSTLHMDVSLDDLEWCIDEVMPTNPAYLMALPTKNDPMLSYLTTSFADHVRVREKFGYKINDAMWAFFQQLGIIDEAGKPTEHFGDPIWVYYQYRKAKGDTRSKAAIYAEGNQKIQEVRDRGVPIAVGHGEKIWDLEPELAAQVKSLYEDAKISIWAEMPESFVESFPSSIPLITASMDRVDYVYHPASGEELSSASESVLKEVRKSWGQEVPNVQIIISDGLNARAIMDEGHLTPYLEQLKETLTESGYIVGKNELLIRHGRVRAGYASGEILFGESSTDTPKAIIHIIGERPGSGHHNFSAYMTVATPDVWFQKGLVDHNITRVISGISDTALPPTQAAKETVGILDQMFGGMS